MPTNSQEDENIQALEQQLEPPQVLEAAQVLEPVSDLERIQELERKLAAAQGNQAAQDDQTAQDAETAQDNQAAQKDKERRRSELLFRIVAILFVATLISFYLLTNIQAKYVTLDWDTAQARTATFDVGRDGDLFKYVTIAGLHPNMTVAAGTAHTEKIVITNYSEETVDVTLSAINVTGNMPYSLKLLNSATATTEIAGATWDSTTRTLTYSFRLHPNNTDASTLTTYYLAIDWPGNWDEDTYDTGTSSSEYAGLVDEIDIEVKAEQTIS